MGILNPVFGEIAEVTGLDSGASRAFSEFRVFFSLDDLRGALRAWRDMFANPGKRRRP
jgi:hypothetical protein